MERVAVLCAIAVVLRFVNVTPSGCVDRGRPLQVPALVGCLARLMLVKRAPSPHPAGILNPNPALLTPGQVVYHAVYTVNFPT